MNRCSSECDLAASDLDHPTEDADLAIAIDFQAETAGSTGLIALEDDEFDGQLRAPRKKPPAEVRACRTRPRVLQQCPLLFEEEARADGAGIFARPDVGQPTALRTDAVSRQQLRTRMATAALEGRATAPSPYRPRVPLRARREARHPGSERTALASGGARARSADSLAGSRCRLRPLPGSPRLASRARSHRRSTRASARREPCRAWDGPRTATRRPA